MPEEPTFKRLQGDSLRQILAYAAAHILENDLGHKDLGPVTTAEIIELHKYWPDAGGHLMNNTSAAAACVRADWDVVNAFCSTPPSELREVDKLDAIPEPGESSALLRAHDLVYGDRAKAYGPAEQQFNKIAVMVGQMLTDAELSGLKVGHLRASVICKVMIATKLVREAHKPKQDNRDDACGYIDILDQIMGS